MPRQHSHEVVSAVAACQRCTWTADGKNAQALAARHHDKNGHRVQVTTTTILTYGQSLGEAHKAKAQRSLDI